MIGTVILYGFGIGNFLGVCIVAFHLGKALSRIDFLKNEIMDAQEWDTGKGKVFYESLETILARLNQQEKAIAGQALRISRAESSIPTQKGVGKAMRKMGKAATERLEDIQSNMEVMAAEIKSLKKPARKVAVKKAVKK